MFFDHILFLSSLILYTISPNKWHKALPCICLFLKDFRHEIDLAFLFAALGDLFLHDDWSITCGTLAFGIANIIFGTVFLEYNLYYFIDDSRTSAENNKESAKANDLDVYEYLKYLLTETPNNHHLEDPSVIDSLLPWSKELPEQCLLKRNRKKCLKH